MLVGKVHRAGEEFVLRCSDEMEQRAYVLFLVKGEDTEVLAVMDEHLIVNQLGNLLRRHDTMEVRTRITLLSSYILKAQGMADTMVKKIGREAHSSLLDAKAILEEFKG